MKLTTAPLQEEGFLLLLQSSLKSIPFNLFLAIFIWLYLLYRHASFAQASGWCLAIILLSLIRWSYSKYSIRKKAYITDHRRTLTLFISLTFFMGLLWGMCYVFFYPNFSEMHQNVITLVLGGMASGALASLSIYPPAYYAYLLPMFLPLIVYNYGLQEVDSCLLATMFILFVIMLIITARFPSKLLQETLKLAGEKDSLIVGLHEINAEKDEILKEIQRISITDDMTGLYNRRFFDSRLAEEFRRAKRNNYPLSLVLIDVDDFKEINDSYGHPAGDTYLKAVAKAIEETAIRANDMAFRIGGDEFALILANSDAEHAILLCSKIQAKLDEYALPHHVSLSIGIAALTSNCGLVKELVTNADNALYEAKYKGKNQIKKHPGNL